MLSWLAETNTFKNISAQLIQPHQEHYSQEKYRVITNTDKIIKHIRTPNLYDQHIYGLLIQHKHKTNDVCLIYMHGLSSNILEGCPLLEHIPDSMSFFCFDFSGSGKSEGQICSYGLKESQDIKIVLNRLEEEGYQRFILWGRSMGAVASLIFTSTLPLTHKIMLQIVDSPFCNFESICHRHAKTFLNIPQVLISSALQIIKQSLEHQRFNPFDIDVSDNVKQCTVATIFVYNQTDDVIPAQNTQKIIANLHKSCIYERVTILDRHNYPRSFTTLNIIFERIQKYIRLWDSNDAGKTGKRQLLNVISNKLKKQRELRNSIICGNVKQKRGTLYCSLSKQFQSIKSHKKGNSSNHLVQHKTDHNFNSIN